MKTQSVICLLATMLTAACANTEFAGRSGKAPARRAAEPTPGGNTPTNTSTDTTVTPTDTDTDGNVGTDTDASTGRLGEETEEQTIAKLATNEGDVATPLARCQPNDAAQIFELDGSGSQVKLRGELCPHVYGKLTLLFVVDFSNSMQDNDPVSLFNLFTCGRSRAATAILDRVRADMRPGDDVQVSFVSFGSTAQVESELRPIDEFSANVFNFCGSRNEFTNYKAAMQTARTQLEAAPGNKVMYFISDGLPTSGGNGPDSGSDELGVHKAAGLDAAADLRQLPALTMNAVYLNAGGGTTAAEQYLSQITGDYSRVRVADGAGDLADKIVELSIPTTELSTALVSATLSAPGFANRNIAIESLERDLEHPGVWFYTTAEFTLNRAPHTVVDNLVTVSAKDQAGTSHLAKVVLRVPAN